MVEFELPEWDAPISAGGLSTKIKLRGNASTGVFMTISCFNNSILCNDSDLRMIEETGEKWRDIERVLGRYLMWGRML